MHLIKVCDTKNMPVEEWLKRRKNGIGGSDAGALLGFNRYKGPFNVYVDKVTEHTDDLSENEKVYWGNVFEPIVAKEFARRTGKKVERVNAILRHPKYEYIIANIDRRVVGENAILECKTTGAFNEAEWKDEEIPESYICQCQHYMAVTGAEKCYIACLIGGQKLIIKTILRDDEFIEYLLDAEIKFWKEFVLAGKPPDIDGSADAARYLSNRFERSDGGSIQMTSDLEELCSERQSLKKQEADIKGKIAEYDNKIKLRMGENAYAFGNRYKVSWVNTKGRKTLDTDKLKSDFSIEDMESYYKTGAPSRRFTIQEVG